MARRVTWNEKANAVRMVEDARRICFKMQNDIELDDEDERRLAAMPEDVRVEIIKCGNLSPPVKRRARQ